MPSVITIRGIILLALGLFVVLMALRSLRAKRLKEEYALLYVFIGLPFLVLAVWPDAIVLISDLLQIEKATFLVLVTGSFLLMILFKLTSIISVQDRRINSLTQLLAIMNEQRQHQSSDSPADSETPDANQQS